MCEGPAAGRDRDVLNDTGRHPQRADCDIYGEIGLIEECAVEDGGIAGAWRAEALQLLELFHSELMTPVQEKLASTCRG